MYYFVILSGSSSLWEINYLIEFQASCSKLCWQNCFKSESKIYHWVFFSFLSVDKNNSVERNLITQIIFLLV